MLLFAVDEDSATRTFVAQALAGSEFNVQLAGSQEQAMSMLREAAPPVLLLCGPPKRSSRKVYGHLRRAWTRQERYAIATLGPGEGADMIDAIEAGADDVLIKPFTANELLARLRLAVRSFQVRRYTSSSLMEVIREGLAHESGGEIVVRAHETVAYIYVTEGKIAWIHVSPALRPAIETLRAFAGASLDAETVDAVLDESKRTGQHFAKTLVAWGLFDEATAREYLRSCIGERLEFLLALPNTTSLFLPIRRPYSGDLSFSFEEFLPSAIAPRSVLPYSTEGMSISPLDPARQRIFVLWVNRILGLEGALGAVVIDRGTGATWVQEGRDCDTRVAWPLVETLSALGDGAQAMAEHHQLGLVAQCISQGCALVVVFDLQELELNTARASLSELLAELEKLPFPSSP